MLKKQLLDPPKIEALTFDCPCGGDEMLYNGKPTFKKFRKFFCPTCHSTLWLSEAGFNQADESNKIMQR